MTRYTNSFDSGSNGTGLTLANTAGGGTAFDALDISGSATAVFDNTHVAHGGLSAKFTPATDGLAYTIWDSPGSTHVAARCYIYATAAPSAQVRLMFFAAGSTKISAIDLLATGTIAVEDQSGGSTIYNFANAMPLNQWIRVEAEITVGSTTANGTISVAYYAADSTTPIDSYTSSVRNLGTAAITRNRFGVISSISPGPIWFDDVAFEDAASGYIGPFTNQPPTVTLTANQNVAAASSVSVSATASDPDGSIASYAWTVVGSKSTSTPTLSGATAATCTFTAPAAGNLVTLQCVATDNSGGQTTKTTEVRVPVAGNFAPLALDGTGGWTNTGGAATTGAALADSSDSTLVQSGSYSASESEFRQRLQPLTVRSALTLTVRSLVSDTGGTTKVRLYEGSTQRQEWTLTQATAAADQTFTVTSPGAITDWGNLWLAAAVVA